MRVLPGAWAVGVGAMAARALGTRRISRTPAASRLRSTNARRYVLQIVGLTQEEINRAAILVVDY